MIHIRVADIGVSRRFICGIGPALPKGDTYWFDGESGAARADCPGCNPAGPRKLGTPLSELSGQPGKPGYEQFKAIARSWGHE